MFSILHDAGCLTKEQWKERARDAGLGTSRKADLHDLRTALLHKQDCMPMKGARSRA
jgi:hypothetical protein